MATQKSDNEARPEQAHDRPGLGKAVMDSAQQIWLAGLGAFSKAQAEGGKLFDSLVREGAAFDAKTRDAAAASVGETSRRVESTLDSLRERSQQTWGSMEKVFEERLAKTLNRMGVPTRGEVESLGVRVEELSREVRRLGARKSASSGAAASRGTPPEGTASTGASAGTTSASASSGGATRAARKTGGI